MEKLSESIVEAINSLKKPSVSLPPVLSGQPPAGGSIENTPSLILTNKYPKNPDGTGIPFLEKQNNRANLTGKLAVAMWKAENYEHLEEGIKRASRCGGVRIVEGGKTTKVWMCGKRWCANCSNVRASILFQRFKPVIDELNDLYFVTLTTASPPEEKLGERIQTMNKVFGSIHRHIKEYKKQDFNAIRRIEYTDGKIDGKIHPHFHCVVQGKSTAETLRAEWIMRMNKEGIYTSALGQDIKPCNQSNNYAEGVLFEILKYIHKPLKEETKTSKDGKEQKTGRYFVNGWKVNEAWKQITSMKFRLLSTYGKFYGIKIDLTDQEVRDEIQAYEINVPDGTYVRERGKTIHLESGQVVCNHSYKTQSVYDTRLGRDITISEVEVLKRIPLKEEEKEQITPRWIPNAPTPPPE